MKNSITTGILCLLIGIAIGWVAKPSPETASHQPAPATSKTPPRPASGSNREEPGQKSDRPQISSRTVIVGGDSPDEETMKAMKNSQNKMEDMMIDRQRKKFDRRIADLVKKLNLNPDQEAALKTLFEKKLEAMNGFMSMDEMANPEKMKEFAALFRSDALDEEMTALLDAGQLEAYDTMKTEDRSRKMDAKALKDLSKLTGVLALSPEQKDGVYEILYEQAGDKIDNPSTANLIMSLSMEGMGIEYDIEDSGIGDALDLQMEAGDGQPIDQKAMMKLAQEKAAKRIDDKVALLSGILDEDQRARYREHLDTKNQNLFGGMMFQGIETETTIEPGATIVPAAAEE